eukprot:383256-Amphidinium_carterae.1
MHFSHEIHPERNWSRQSGPDEPDEVAESTGKRSILAPLCLHPVHSPKHFVGSFIRSIIAKTVGFRNAVSPSSVAVGVRFDPLHFPA